MGIQPVDILLALHLVKKKTKYGYFAMIILVDFSYPQYTTEIYLYARQNIILYICIISIYL